MKDEEYLQEAGLDEQGRDLLNPVPDESAPAPPSPSDMLVFEAAGKQYQVPNSANLSFKHNDQQIQKPINTILNGYRQVSELDRKTSEFKTQQQQHMEQLREYEELKAQKERLATLEQLDAWTKENPEMFEHLWKNYENRDKLALQQPGATPEQAPMNQQVVDTIAGLQQQVRELAEFKSNYDQKSEEAAVEEDMKFIENQISEFQEFLNKEFPSVDGKGAAIALDSADENGISLRNKIIKHGLDKGYPDFESAALSYLKPQLLEKAIERGRTEAVKGIKTKNQLGIVSEQSTPPMVPGRQGPDPDDSSKSWDELAEEAKDELKQMSANEG